MTFDITTLRNDFVQTGFAIASNLFTRDEVQRLKLECIDILEAVKTETGAVAGHGVHVGLAARSPVFQTAVGDARILDILEGILAPDIEFLSDKVVFKSETTTFASPWHQDWSYWHGAHKVSIWVALDDATVENGCLKLFPGSHESAIVHDGDASDGHGFGNRLRPGAVDESRAVTAEIEAGGAVFFPRFNTSLQPSEPFWRRTLGLDSDVSRRKCRRIPIIRGLSLRKFYAAKNCLNQDWQDKKICRIRSDN